MDYCPKGSAIDDNHMGSAIDYNPEGQQPYYCYRLHETVAEHHTGGTAALLKHQCDLQIPKYAHHHWQAGEINKIIMEPARNLWRYRIHHIAYHHDRCQHCDGLIDEC